MSCDRCRELHTHKLQVPKYLLNAVAVALDNVQHGTLREVPVKSGTLPEQLPLASFAESASWPDIVTYRFRCEACGQRFELFADTYHGTGRWEQEGEVDAT
jgi:hypothetical protein